MVVFYYAQFKKIKKLASILTNTLQFKSINIIL